LLPALGLKRIALDLILQDRALPRGGVMSIEAQARRDFLAGTASTTVFGTPALSNVSAFANSSKKLSGGEKLIPYGAVVLSDGPSADPSFRDRVVPGCQLIVPESEIKWLEQPRAPAAYPDDFLLINVVEIASRDWPEPMIPAAEEADADVVGNPVLQCFVAKAKCGLQRLGRPAFDLRFHFLGCGDLDFFARCRQNGMQFHWVADVVIVETMLDTRIRSSLIALLKLRIGAINYHVQRKMAQTPRFSGKLATKVLALLPLSLCCVVRLFLTDYRTLLPRPP
jgi:hypothetical protein